MTFREDGFVVSLVNRALFSEYGRQLLQLLITPLVNQTCKIERKLVVSNSLIDSTVVSSELPLCL
jgi:hypothetical protein